MARSRQRAFSVARMLRRVSTIWVFTFRYDDSIWLTAVEYDLPFSQSIFCVSSEVFQRLSVIVRMASCWSSSCSR